jgi:hypothetical protein
MMQNGGSRGTSCGRLVRKSGIVALLVVAGIVLSGTPAVAKGAPHIRGYAVLTGPGLEHPIVVSAPWNPHKGGYYGGEAEIFIAFAEGTGAIPAGRDFIGGGVSVPEGVLPLHEELKASGLGPSYRLTWFRDDLDVIVKQDIYPYRLGLPVVYTEPLSRKGLLTLFGRFQAPHHVWTGWGKGTDAGLLLFLWDRGLPKTAPTTPPSRDPRSAVDAIAPALPVPTRSATSRPDIAVAAALAILLSSTALYRRRRRRAPLME